MKAKAAPAKKKVARPTKPSKSPAPKRKPKANLAKRKKASSSASKVAATAKKPAASTRAKASSGTRGKTALPQAKIRPRRDFAGPKDVRLLVVDDESEVLDLLVPFLKRQGYTVSEAQDGDQALEKILTERPNIVILDVMMPGLSGWEISRYVRERSELDPVRIIMATGIGKETNAATSPLYGADAYIDKPFRLDALHRTVREVIKRIETGQYE